MTQPTQTALERVSTLLFDQNGMDRAKVERIVRNGLSGADDGELYVEQTLSEGLSWTDGKLKGNSMSVREGFGLRYVAGEAFAYAHNHMMDEKAVQSAMKTVKGLRSGGKGGSLALSTTPAHVKSKGGVYIPQYQSDSPLAGHSREDRIRLLEKVDAYARSLDSRVHDATVSVVGEMKNVLIIRKDGLVVADERPLVSMRINVDVKQGTRMESGSYSFGGRHDFAALFNEQTWKAGVDEALRSALVNLEAIDTPAGSMDVVLGPGWTGGVMLHEAVGHGLEGDFNRKGTSIYSNRVGQQVASKGVTVVDQGDIPNRRGSLNFDDEGTRTQENILIEDGILKGYMQDRMNARLMGVAPTGNGRRENYTFAPMPRMTTTFMRAGTADPQEIIESVKKGFFAARISGGQVDITSGKYVFNVEEGYIIENGKIGAPVKGGTLIGNGPDTMTKIDMIGNDLALDPGLGACGKAGQSLPVGVGHPTVKIRNLTVGGTATPS